MAGNTFVQRGISPELEKAMRDSPVVFLGGPRQSGKSTLVRQVVAEDRYVTLDDPVPLAAASSDPDGFVAGLARGSAIDEVQRAPDLLRAIKATIDRDRRPGRFVLTGSADIFSVPRVAESLAGRMQLLTLWPFSERELADSSGSAVDRLFDPRTIEHSDPRADRADVLARVVRGGYPEVVARRSDRRGAWFEAYVAAVTLRDVRELADIRGVTELPRLLRLLAARVGTILNAAELSRASGLPQSTLGRYLTLLEATFVFRPLPAWSGSLSKRLHKHPKVFLCDSGLATFLAGVDQARFAVDEHLAGPYLECLVVTELTKQSGWSAAKPSLHHFRSVAGDEVDIVLERRDGSVVGVEVKASSRVQASDFNGLRTLAAALRRKFVRGVVLYMGAQTIAFGDRLLALPLSALWRL